MAIPHAVKAHPVTGLNNGKLGIWLFLASEVMLFGALFSTYVLLRVGAPESGPAAWPSHDETHLSWKIGGFNTLVLIVSSVTMVMAWASFKAQNFSKGRMFLGITVALALVFIVVKLLLEYIPKLQHVPPHGPSYNNFFAIYFTLTGLHALHILGGVVIMLYFMGPGSKLWHKDQDYFTNRIECTGLYWHFVDLVWIFLFPVLYLM